MKIDIKLLLLVVAISVITSFVSYFFLSKVTESDIWKQTSIEAIYTIGELEKANENQATFIRNMIDDLKEIENDTVKFVLNKYGIK